MSDSTAERIDDAAAELELTAEELRELSHPRPDKREIGPTAQPSSAVTSASGSKLDSPRASTDRYSASQLSFQ